MRKFVLGSLFSLLAALMLLPATLKVEAGSIPPWPQIYSGYITVGGSAVGNGAIVTAKMGDYTAQPVVVRNGRYAGLAVGGPDSTFFGKTITFHLDGQVIAEETDVFSFNSWIVVNSSFDLTFPEYPTPTPTPMATPTNTPIPTATPDLPSAMEISGVVEVDGGGDPAHLEGEHILARVGSYFSEPVALELIATANFKMLVFDGLFINPMDFKFVGRDLTFVVGGLEATGNSAVYEPGANVDLALRVELVPPTEIPVATPTPIPAIPAIPAIPVATLMPTEVPTVVPTEVPTAVTIQATPKPPTTIILIATATPAPPTTPTPEPTVAPILVEDVEETSSGSCNAIGKTSPLTGAANALMLFAPLLLVGGYKGFRGWRK